MWYILILEILDLPIQTISIWFSVISLFDSSRLLSPWISLWLAVIYFQYCIWCLVIQIPNHGIVGWSVYFILSFFLLIYQYFHCNPSMKQNTISVIYLIPIVVFQFVKLIHLSGVYHFHDMIDMLVKCGYKKGTTLFGYGYDFRQSNRWVFVQLVIFLVSKAVFLATRFPFNFIYIQKW